MNFDALLVYEFVIVVIKIFSKQPKSAFQSIIIHPRLQMKSIFLQLAQTEFGYFYLLSIKSRADRPLYQYPEASWHDAVTLAAPPLHGVNILVVKKLCFRHDRITWYVRTPCDKPFCPNSVVYVMILS